MVKRGTPAFFLVFWAHSKAVSRNTKNGEERHRALVKHGNARAGERHQLVGHQMNEQVRHRAVQALEGEPGKVARAGADTTQRHLGHALGGKAGNEAVAQVAHAADVDVAHRVVVSTREDGEEVEVLRGSLHQAAQLHLQFQEAVLLPRCADGGHVLPRVGQQVDLGARVVVPKRAHEFREGARHGDVVLRHAVRDAGLLRVHCGVAEHQDLPERSTRLKDSTSAESRTTWEARTRTFWISKSVLSVAPAGCAPAFSDHSAVVASANSISITRFSCGGSIFPQRRMPTMVGRSSTSA